MDIYYRRTPAGDREVATRAHALDRWSRTVLIVLGQGKPSADLSHELRTLPVALEYILSGLIEKGLIVRVVSGNAMEPVHQPRPTPPSAAKDAQRYFTYLIGIVENADSSQSLALTIALKRANTPEALTALIAPFHSSLEKIVGKEEARRLMGKLPAYQ